MRRRRTVLRAGLALVTGASAGCIEQTLPDEIADPQVGESTETGSSGRSGEGSPGTTTGRTDVRDGLVVVGATGTNIDGKYVGTVRVTVEKGPEAERIDLRAVEVAWTDPGGEYRVVANTTESSKAHGHFGVVPAEGTGDADVPVIDAPGERFDLVFDLGRDQTTVDDPRGGVSGRPSFGRRVQAGWTLDLIFITGSGTRSEANLTVPDAVGGRDTVSLLSRDRT